MRLGIFSDLHLDFYKKEASKIVDNICSQAKEEGVDMLLNAGDLCNSMYKIEGIEARRAFKELPCRYFEAIGNHDLYFEEYFDEHQIVTNPEFSMFIGTLWTDFHNDPVAEYQFNRTMSDADCIRNISPARIKETFYRHKTMIFERHHDIVMTHNPPSHLSVGPKFINATTMNKIFIPELGNEIADSSIKLWICGHVHHKHEYMIGNTKIVCNPLAYPGEIYRNPLDYRIHVEEIY